MGRGGFLHAGARRWGHTNAQEAEFAHKCRDGPELGILGPDSCKPGSENYQIGASSLLMNDLAF